MTSARFLLPAFFAFAYTTLASFGLALMSDFAGTSCGNCIWFQDFAPLTSMVSPSIAQAKGSAMSYVISRKAAVKQNGPLRPRRAVTVPIVERKALRDFIADLSNMYFVLIGGKPNLVAIKDNRERLVAQVQTLLRLEKIEGEVKFTAVQKANLDTWWLDNIKSEEETARITDTAPSETAPNRPLVDLDVDLDLKELPEIDEFEDFTNSRFSINKYDTLPGFIKKSGEFWENSTICTDSYTVDFEIFDYHVRGAEVFICNPTHALKHIEFIASSVNIDQVSSALALTEYTVQYVDTCAWYFLWINRTRDVKRTELENHLILRMQDEDLVLCGDSLKKESPKNRNGMMKLKESKIRSRAHIIFRKSQIREIEPEKINPVFRRNDI